MREKETVNYVPDVYGCCLGNPPIPMAEGRKLWDEKRHHLLAVFWWWPIDCRSPLRRIYVVSKPLGLRGRENRVFEREDFKILI